MHLSLQDVSDINFSNIFRVSVSLLPRGDGFFLLSITCFILSLLWSATHPWKNKNKNRKWETVQLFFFVFLVFHKLCKPVYLSQTSPSYFQIWYPQKEYPQFTSEGEFEFEFDSSWMLFFSNITRKIQAKYKFIISSDVLATTWVTIIFMFYSLIQYNSFWSFLQRFSFPPFQNGWLSTW